MDLEQEIEKINNLGTYVKAAYMMCLLAPERETSFIVFEEDEPTTFEFEGKTIQVKKGHIVNKKDRRIPDEFWDNVTAKYRHFNQKEYFQKISAGYIVKIINYLLALKDESLAVSEQGVLANEQLTEIILEPFDDKIIAELVFINTVQEFMDNEDGVVSYLKSKMEKKEHCEPSTIVMAYLLFKHQTELINKWMFSHQELKDLLKIMGISDDVLW